MRFRFLGFITSLVDLSAISPDSLFFFYFFFLNLLARILESSFEWGETHLQQSVLFWENLVLLNQQHNLLFWCVVFISSAMFYMWLHHYFCINRSYLCHFLFFFAHVACVFLAYILLFLHCEAESCDKSSLYNLLLIGMIYVIFTFLVLSWFWHVDFCFSLATWIMILTVFFFILGKISLVESFTIVCSFDVW